MCVVRMFRMEKTIDAIAPRRFRAGENLNRARETVRRVAGARKPADGARESGVRSRRRLNGVRVVNFGYFRFKGFENLH